jgi:hypothetical protein
MENPTWELVISQRNSLRRYIVAFFQADWVLVQVADVVSKTESGELIEFRRMACCKLRHAPDTVWDFFKTQPAGPNTKFSFNMDVHFNLYVPRKDVAVFCFNTAEEEGHQEREERPFSLEAFRVMFCKVISKVA